jgi:phenylalanyl-tRNA synthetase alpha chain
MSNGDLAEVEREAIAAVQAAGSLSELEAARVAHTGRRSRLAAALAGIGSLPAPERGAAGRAANAARAAVEGALRARAGELEAEELGAALERDTTDVTLPGDPYPRGALHPITQIRREMEEIFLALGYYIADGPEVETDWHNFTALNTPEGHPARSSSDNFYLAGRPDRLLRSQTSPVQVRAMQAEPPPIYLVAPGFVYRRDDVDATHSPQFTQMEGLAVDEGLTMAHLKGTMLHFARELLGADREIVLNPHFFPFTEPSVDVQVTYTDRSGRPGWLELAGAGMVDPNVLSACGIDPERHSGFAFGWGLDRIAMIRFRVPDLRLFYENDLRFLEQFA